MRQGFFECEKHNSHWRRKATDAMPYASKIVPVVGGYIGFESWNDYELWKIKSNNIQYNYEEIYSSKGLRYR